MPHKSRNVQNALSLMAFGTVPFLLCSLLLRRNLPAFSKSVTSESGTKQKNWKKLKERI